MMLIHLHGEYDLTEDSDGKEMLFHMDKIIQGGLALFSIHVCNLTYS